VAVVAALPLVEEVVVPRLVTASASASAQQHQQQH
jgi:hypothetical protein